MDSYFRARDILDKAMGTDAYFQIKSILTGMKAADVVEVARCRECKYHKPIDYCEKHKQTGWFDDDFCSRGQRKEADHEVSGKCG